MSSAATATSAASTAGSGAGEGAEEAAKDSADIAAFFRSGECGPGLGNGEEGPAARPRHEVEAKGGPGEATSPPWSRAGSEGRRLCQVASGKARPPRRCPPAPREGGGEERRAEPPRPVPGLKRSNSRAGRLPGRQSPGVRTGAGPGRGCGAAAARAVPPVTGAIPPPERARSGASPGPAAPQPRKCPAGGCGAGGGWKAAPIREARGVGGARGASGVAGPPGGRREAGMTPL